MKKSHLFLLLITCVLIAIDFATKATLYRVLSLADISILSNAVGGLDFSLTLALNKGVAWGLFPQLQKVILVLRIAVVIGIFAYLFKSRERRILNFPLILIVAGGIGNVIDYFIYGSVVDFFCFNLWGYHFPVFNVADIYITSGVGALFLITTLQKHERKHNCN